MLFLMQPIVITGNINMAPFMQEGFGCPKDRQVPQKILPIPATPPGGPGDMGVKENGHRGDRG